ncbi:MAG: M23 family metallopeptidase [Chthoniobacterales bacterium]
MFCVKIVLRLARFSAVVAPLVFSRGAFAADVFTPVIASTLASETRAVYGTDQKFHVIYELQLSNTKNVPATIQAIDVLDGGDSAHAIVSYSGPEIVEHLRTLAPEPASDAIIEPNGARLFYIELAFDKTARIPSSLQHRLHLTGAANPGPAEAKPLDYIVAPFQIAQAKPVVIGPPLDGKGWVAVNGCCNDDIVHRGSVLSVNGRLYDAQRFAIDWMQMDEQGRFVHGDASKVENFTSYGAEVHAVADGTVVSRLDTLDDQPPGKLPEPSSITIETVDGNHVVIDIGGGCFAFYAHLQKDSVKVHVGDTVKKGAVLGKLGNSGNTSAPHLHFHIMNAASVLASDGLPYVFDAFHLAGEIELEMFNAAPGVEGDWSKGRFDETQPRQREFPLNLNVIDF